MGSLGPALRSGDPALAAVANALEERGFAGEVWDAAWRVTYISPEYRKLASIPDPGDDALALGAHILSARAMAVRDAWPTGPTFESFRESLRSWGGFIAATTPGGLDALLAIADSRLADALRSAAPEAPPAAWSTSVEIRFGDQTIANDVVIMRILGDGGQLAGFAVLVKPAVRAAVLGMLALGDARLFEQMSGILDPARRPAAILFADLENSTALSRRLSTPAYFALIRRLTRRTDRVVVDAAGIVGKHVGDGVTAFFLAEEAGSESRAAEACITAMRGIREAARRAADRSGLAPEDVTMRFGLHWGATPYVGRLMTSGRAEVTALGEEINEAARIEGCATGGLALASKALIERLDPAGAHALGLEAGQLTYARLADLPHATDKARQDAPALAVCAI